MDRHTYISAAVTALFCLLMLLGLVVLYKKLAPRNTSQSTPRKRECTNHVADDLDGVEKGDLGERKYYLTAYTFNTVVPVVNRADLYITVFI